MGVSVRTGVAVGVADAVGVAVGTGESVGISVGATTSAVAVAVGRFTFRFRNPPGRLPKTISRMAQSASTAAAMAR